jgi:23S rRNA (uracil1939-C5)-methyltransferase
MQKTSTKPKRGDRLSIHIDRLSVGGRGVGRANELVIFVPDVCPDEDVEVEVTFVKKNFAEARLLRVITPSNARVKPPCPVAGVCGGCNWQHVSYAEQIHQKRALVRESLRKFSGFDVSQESAVQPVLASPKTLRYRNRVQFHHSGSELGYYQRGSHQLVSVADCPIAEESIAALIPALKSRLKTEPAGRIEVFIAEDNSVQTRGGPGQSSPEVSTDDDDEGGLSFAFSQVNTPQNQILISLVVDQFMQVNAGQPSPIVYDLYAGSGNFTFPIANAFPNARITAVELNRESVERGQKKAQESFENHDIRWVQSDVGAFLSSENIPDGAWILIDPPRSGCEPEVALKLAQSSVGRLVYVSCHPVTLARDLKFFRDAGFRLESVRPLDMFPQTDHVETVVVLTRSTSV